MALAKCPLKSGERQIALKMQTTQEEFENRSAMQRGNVLATEKMQIKCN